MVDGLVLTKLKEGLRLLGDGFVLDPKKYFRKPEHKKNPIPRLD